MSKLIYCIEEQFPDGKGNAINHVELPIKEDWYERDIIRWPLLHEYDNEEKFKNDLINMLKSNVLISKVFIKYENENYKPLMKL